MILHLTHDESLTLFSGYLLAFRPIGYIVLYNTKINENTCISPLSLVLVVERSYKIHDKLLCMCVCVCVCVHVHVCVVCACGVIINLDKGDRGLTIIRY